MALFGRSKRKPSDEELVDHDEVAEGGVRPQPPEGVPGVDRDWERAQDGPYDVSEWSDLDGRLDFGALRIPAVQGMQLRMEMQPGTTKVVGLNTGFGASQAQLQVFAAPRTMGLWSELRPDIADGLVQAGGAAEIVEGVLGKEIKARMPGKAPDGKVAFQPARFLGVDGPRWFLRVVINGPAATDDVQLRPILDFVRQCVITRGDEPRPPREVLELTAPQSIMEAAARQAELRKQAAAQAAARQTRVLRNADATGAAGITPGAPTAGGSQPDGGQNNGLPPQPPLTDAPKPPHNPEFT